MAGESACGASCGSAAHFNRRTLLRAAGWGGLCWLTPLAEILARAADRSKDGSLPRSVIVLWLDGGPSQLETFDPHSSTAIGGQTVSIPTRVAGVQLGSALEQTADLMDRIAIVRSLTSKEGDHERAVYNMKTGFRPDPTLVHPALGAVICHQLHDDVEIPRHISILPGKFPTRGGYLGDQYDAFRVPDPQSPIPDVQRYVPQPQFERRLDDLFQVVEPEFARGRLQHVDATRTLHDHAIRQAVRMMSSEQLQAFDIRREPESVLRAYGDTPFGRGCLAAVRLIGVGVRCVEVTLGGWDSHINNHEIQTRNAHVLDAAFATLLHDLEQRGLWEQTIVMVGGEFGRTPRINAAGGRDHWPHGFSVALAGGVIRGGQVIGETSPEMPREGEDPTTRVRDPHNVADLHATILSALGIDFKRELMTPVGRPMVISQGQVIGGLLADEKVARRK